MSLIPCVNTGPEFDPDQGKILDILKIVVVTTWMVEVCTH